MKFLARLKQHAAGLKLDILALYLALRDARTPPLARWLVVAIVAYALSPIDLIPDFIPIIGYLDDLILLPLGIALAIKLLPTALMQECREQAQQRLYQDLPVSRAGALIVVGIWLVLLASGAIWLARVLS